MAWIQYRKIDYSNCIVANVLFINNPSKRRTLANLYLNADFWIEADLHLSDPKSRRGRWWHKELQCAYATSNFKRDKWMKTYNCFGTHLSVYIKNNKIYSKSKNKLREFDNPWLLNRIMKLVFRVNND